MKNLRLSLGVAAIAIGSFTAFSFAPASSDAKVALQEFYMNPNGTRGGAVVGSSDCEGDNPRICSQQYDTTTNLPTNDPQYIHKGERP